MTVEQITVDKAFIKSMDKYRKVPKDKKLIEACKDNFILFCEKMLGFIPYAWQIYFVKEMFKVMNNPTLEDREFLALTSRQIGKSTIIAALSLWASLFNKYPGTVYNNTLVGIASASDVQAKKLLYEIKKLLRLGDKFMSDKYQDADGKPIFGKAYFTRLLDDHEPNNTTTITFKPHNPSVHGTYLLAGSKSGSVIKSYPPTSAVLGETFSIVIIDEAGKTDKITDEFFYDYMYPTGNSTNAIRVYTSTPWVSSGFFYRLVDPDEIFSATTYTKACAFTIDAIQIENPEYHKTVMKIVDQLKADGKLDEVQRAYYVRFVKGEQSYFDAEKVIDAFDHKLAKIEEYKEPCDMGIDFGGQVKSRTVITISKLDDNGNVVRLYDRVYAVGKDLSLLDDVEALQKRFDVQRIIPDDCLDEDTLVLMADNTRKKIKDIKVGEFVWSYDFKEKNYCKKRVTKVLDKGVQDTNEIVFRNGTSVFATDSHRWFTKDRVYGNVKVTKTKDLNIKKTYIPQADIPSRDFTIYDDTAAAYLLGMYIAEGHRRPTKKAFFISQLREDIRENIKIKLVRTNWKWQENKKGFYLSDIKEYKELFEKVGKGECNKKIPEEVFSWSNLQLNALWKGLIDGDGYIRREGIDNRGYNYGHSEVYCTSSRYLARDFKLLGNYLGKPCTIYNRVHSGFGSKKLQYEIVWRANGSLTKGRTNIKEIVPGGKRNTYDIMVKDTESFILADSGVITHNCPAGDFLIRKMKEKGWNVHPMNFRTDKVKKYGAFRSKLNRGKMISYNDEDLKVEMLAMENSQGSRQSVIQAAPGYNDDRIDSWVLSTYFFLEDSKKTKFFSYYGDDDSNDIYDTKSFFHSRRRNQARL